MAGPTNPPPRPLAEQLALTTNRRVVKHRQIPEVPCASDGKYRHGDCPLYPAISRCLLISSARSRRCKRKGSPFDPHPSARPGRLMDSTGGGHWRVSDYDWDPQKLVSKARTPVAAGDAHCQVSLALAVPLLQNPHRISDSVLPLDQGPPPSEHPSRASHLLGAPARAACGTAAPPDAAALRLQVEGCTNDLSNLRAFYVRLRICGKPRIGVAAAGSTSPRLQLPMPVPHFNTAPLLPGHAPLCRGAC